MSNTSKGRDNQGGSKDWMQQIINSDMRTQLEELTGEGETDWLLPLKKDDYSEYQLNQEPISKHFGFDGNTFSQWWPF
ncbi:MAG: hypothetical protein LBB40_03070, partial [Holophagales bacterium]|nr:hypothetical protein [Holophagales bacterium]